MNEEKIELTPLKLEVLKKREQNELEKKDLIREIERLSNIIKEQGIDKPNYYVKGLEGSLKEYQQEIERLNNKEEQIIRRLEDLIIVGEQVENEWAVDICKMIINELKGSGKE